MARGAARRATPALPVMALAAPQRPRRYMDIVYLLLTLALFALALGFVWLCDAVRSQP